MLMELLNVMLLWINTIEISTFSQIYKYNYFFKICKKILFFLYLIIKLIKTFIKNMYYLYGKIKGKKDE